MNYCMVLEIGGIIEQSIQLDYGTPLGGTSLCEHDPCYSLEGIEN